MTNPNIIFGREIIWRGYNSDNVECQIALEQWENHVAKRPEIANALELVIQAMLNSEGIEPDKNRPDEPMRCFKLLTVSGFGEWEGYQLKVSVKYVRFAHRRLRLTVRQVTGDWIKFYQSCWYERKRG